MSEQHAESVVMREVLDDAETSLRISDFNRLAKVIFVWSQRKDHLLAGEETWADQRIGPPRWGVNPADWDAHSDGEVGS